MADARQVLERHWEGLQRPRCRGRGRLDRHHTGVLHTPSNDVPPTGRRVEFRWAAVYETNGDELTSEHLYFDQVELLAQLGLM